MNPERFHPPTLANAAHRIALVRRAFRPAHERLTPHTLELVRAAAYTPRRCRVPSEPRTPTPQP
jgi:hypothetical protein